MKSYYLLSFLFFSTFLGFGQSPNSSFSTSLPVESGHLNVCVNDLVEFYNTSTNTSSASTYSWNFGGGASPANSNAFSNIVVSYSQVGNFVASLQVNNNNGQPVSIFSLNITVLPIPTGGLSLANQGNGFSTSTYNGITVFKNCTALDSTIFSFNATSTMGSSQLISWGDGTSSTVVNANSLSHQYGIGQFNLTYTLTAANGCAQTYSYIVFNGSSPVITVSGSGQNTCVPFPYPIDIIANDVPISYYVSYSDQTNPLSFTTNNDTTISHVFNTSSCGQDYFFSSFLPPIPNAYSATIVAQNLCSNNGFPTVITIGPITISQGVEPLIEMSPDSPVCLNESIVFDNSSISGLNITADGCDSSYHFFWRMQEGAGYSLMNGQWGSDNGFAFDTFDPSEWTNGSESIELQFQTPGLYHLQLFVGSPCGLDSVVKSFEIKPLSSVEINLANQTICSGNTIQEVIFTSVVPDYNIYWEITDSQNVSGWPQNQGMGSSPLSIADWVLVNNGSETGYVDISASVGCTVVPPSVHRIFVNPQGNVMVNPPTQSICNNSETDIQISSNINDAVFVWEVDDSGSNIVGASDGTGEEITQLLTNSSNDFDTIYYHVAISNSACPGLEGQAMVIVQPDLVIQDLTDLILCPETQVNEIIFFSNIDGASFHWENSNAAVGLNQSGNGNIPVWVAENNGLNIESAEVTVFGSFNNCPEVSVDFSIDVYPIPTFSYELNPPSGLGCISPVSILGATNISNPNWAWNGPVILSGNNSNAPLVNQSGTYEVVIVDNISNCQSQFEVEVEPPNTVQLVMVEKEDISCWGINDGSIEVNAVGGVVQFQWTPSVSNSNSAQDLSAGSYTIEAINEDGCLDQLNIDIFEPSALEIFLVDSATSQCGEQNGSLVANATGGVPGYSYQWSNGVSSMENLSIDEGVYSLTVTDNNNCEVESEFTMTCVEFPDIVPYQFISPNNDGQNDSWILLNLDEYERAEIFIFNRWGSLVYQSDNYQNDWKGTCNTCSNSEEVLPSATYYYKIVTNKKSKPDFTGFIEIQP